MKYKLSKKYPKKRAFITGAASGLGRALSIELAKDGWTIAISDINEKGLEETAKLIETNGGKAIAFILDVADKVQYQKVVESYLAESGGIDLLVNNAGVGDGGLFEEYGLENWEWMVGINQMGVIYGCHYFVPVMKKQRSGQIINVSSIASISHSPRMGPYNATKAAVKAISETLYGELKEFNVKVSVMMPFFFRTNIVRYSRGDHESQELANYMVSGSKVSAEKVASRALKQVGRGKFHILEPFQAKVLFHLQRLFPRTFLDLSGLMVKRKEFLINKAKKQYEKNLEKGLIEEPEFFKKKGTG